RWGRRCYRDLLRAFLIVVFGTIYAAAHRIFFHQFRIKWFEAVRNSLWIGDSRIKPAIVVFLLEYGRHPVVYFGHQRIRRRGQDRAALDKSVIGLTPSVPQSRKRKD